MCIHGLQVDPQARERASHPRRGAAVGKPGEIAARPPTLGEHMDVVLAELGYEGGWGGSGPAGQRCPIAALRVLARLGYS